MCCADKTARTAETYASNSSAPLINLHSGADHGLHLPVRSLLNMLLPEPLIMRSDGTLGWPFHSVQHSASVVCVRSCIAAAQGQ